MRKLFALFALMAVVFTACEPDNPEVNYDNLKIKIKLTSDSVMNFGLDGGEGVISFDYEELGEATRSGDPQAATAVEWITDIKVKTNDKQVTFKFKQIIFSF